MQPTGKTRRLTRWSAIAGPVLGLGLLILQQVGSATPSLGGGRAAAQELSDSTAVEIKLFEFGPPTLTVPPGGTVVWTNRDGSFHSVTSGPASSPDGVFDSGLFDEGQTFAFTFDQPGSYPYFCARHPFMAGQITVAE